MHITISFTKTPEKLFFRESKKFGMCKRRNRESKAFFSGGYDGCSDNREMLTMRMRNKAQERFKSALS